MNKNSNLVKSKKYEAQANSKPHSENPKSLRQPDPTQIKVENFQNGGQDGRLDNFFANFGTRRRSDPVFGF